MDKLKVRVSLTGATFDDGVGASPKLQLLRAFPVCNGQYLKSDPRKERWWTTDRVVGGRGSLMHAACLVWSNGWVIAAQANKNELLQAARADLCPLSKHQQWAREPQQWTTEMSHIFWCITWTAERVCVTYLWNTWHQGALWDEGEPAEAVWCFS